MQGHDYFLRNSIQQHHTSRLSLKQTPNPSYQYPWMFLDCLQGYLNIIKKKKKNQDKINFSNLHFQGLLKTEHCETRRVIIGFYKS